LPVYAPDAYFGRMDALYLEGKPIPPSAYTRWLRRYPWRRIKAQAWTVLEMTYIIIGLMRGVPNPVLRRDYRRRLWAVIRRRPRLRFLRNYAIKCALHFHFDRLIEQMKAERAELPPEVDRGPQHPWQPPTTRLPDHGWRSSQQHAFAQIQESMLASKSSQHLESGFGRSGRHN
jgi:Domain of unknown function (DUF4070)